MPHPDLPRALVAAIAAAREAGTLLRTALHQPGGPTGSSVDHADADEPAEWLIRNQLLAAFPDWGYRGEETGVQAGAAEQPIWLIDPNDGTRGFMQGQRGSAVSIGVIHNGKPVLGVVFAFAYPDDDGDLIAWAEGCGPVTRNGKPTKPPPDDSPLTDPHQSFHSRLVVLLGVQRPERVAEFARWVAPARFVEHRSIAYRLALVAAGDAIAAVSVSGPRDYDYAAGHALLRGIGGAVVDGDGREVTYDDTGASECVKACVGGLPNAVTTLVQRWGEAMDVPYREEPTRYHGRFALTALEPGCTVRDAGMRSRAVGCLLGQLAGDSLGQLVEFRRRDDIARSYPDGLRHLKDGGAWNLIAGQPTDDSELALLLARSILHEGGNDRGAVQEAYIDWLNDRQTFDVGNTVGRGIGAVTLYPDRVARVARAEQLAAEFPDSIPSNGSLMRISPLGIFYAGRPHEAAEAARAHSRLTHYNPICQEACAAYVAAISVAIFEQADAQRCYAVALEHARHAEVRGLLERAAVAPPTDFHTLMGSVRIAFQNAFYQLLHAPSLEAGIRDTVEQGGDTDTTGTIAGALLGAIHGQRSLPGRWVRCLLSCRPLPGTPTRHPRAREFWPVDAIELAERLLELGQRR